MSLLQQLIDLLATTKLTTDDTADTHHLKGNRGRLIRHLAKVTVDHEFTIGSVIIRLDSDLLNNFETGFCLLTDLEALSWTVYRSRNQSEPLHNEHRND